MIRKICFLLLAVAASAAAQTSADTMFVKFSDTWSWTSPYALSTIDRLTFSGAQGSDTLNIKLKSGETIRYAISHLEKITFSYAQPNDSVVIELSSGQAQSYALWSLSAITFTGWDRTASADRGTPAAVGSYSLGQNYPNPFNPSTTIQYYLPKESSVTLSVSTVLGQLVGTLVHGQQQAGMHQITWNASAAASGIYYYRLQAGEYLETKSMLLLK
jgi:hypothetical protein